MMAKTHGLTEFAATLEDSIRSMDGVDPDRIIADADNYSRKGKALLPLRPVFVQNDTFQSSDWPMVNLRAKEAERAAQMFAKKKLEPDVGGEGEDMFFDAKEFHTSNKQVANILATTGAASEQTPKPTQVQAAASAVENAKWGDEDEIDIDADDFIDASAGAGEEEKHHEASTEDSDIFVPPS
jgi:hypothetical protein